MALGGSFGRKFASPRKPPPPKFNKPKRKPVPRPGPRLWSARAKRDCCGRSPAGRVYREKRRPARRATCLSSAPRAGAIRLHCRSARNIFSSNTGSTTSQPCVRRQLRPWRQGNQPGVCAEASPESQCTPSGWGAPGWCAEDSTL